MFAVDGGRLKEIQAVSTLPAGYAGNSTTAEILIDSQRGRYVYVSNRGHGSIAVLRHRSRRPAVARRPRRHQAAASPATSRSIPPENYLFSLDQDSESDRAASDRTVPPGASQQPACRFRSLIPARSASSECFDNFASRSTKRGRYRRVFRQGTVNTNRRSGVQIQTGDQEIGRILFESDYLLFFDLLFCFSAKRERDIATACQPGHGHRSRSSIARGRDVFAIGGRIGGRFRSAIGPAHKSGADAAPGLSRGSGVDPYCRHLRPFGRIYPHGIAQLGRRHIKT